MGSFETKFSIAISTKNRISDLIYTLRNIQQLIERNDVECILYDDGSSDGTFEEIKNKFPKIILFRNEVSKGCIYCRNFMLNHSNAKYIISLDDDSNFLSNNPLEEIECAFNKFPNCGLLAFRIFWGKNMPKSIFNNEKSEQVSGFVGCGHVWQKSAWNDIANYPEWFVFYGEEQFAAYQLFKKNIEIHYLPSVLVHHRVDVLARKNNNDYQLRLRRSFRSGWYLYFLFYPLSIIPKKLLYTLWIQIKTKTFKGNIKGTIAIFKAIGDVMINFPKLVKQSNRLTIVEYQNFLKLPETKIYWKPEDERND
jgi:glycosyltransferase involved in cell wall biosynthesis